MAEDDTPETARVAPKVGDVYTLAHPIARLVGGKEGNPIEHVKLVRRPNLGDFKAVAGHGKFDALSVALGRITDLPKAFCDSTDGEDAIGLSEWLYPLFYPAGRTSPDGQPGTSTDASPTS